jgi:LysM repeat protein
MKFTFQSSKPDLKPQNEDFFFERETQRGHFFAVLDFDQHDFVNLNTTLEAKLETIVNSFVTLSRFSPDLFLGFIAKEINSFLYTLAQNDEEQECLCSAALCLVRGDRLSYFTCGDVRVALVNQDQLLLLAGLKVDQRESIRRLGESQEQSPFTDQIQHLTLKEGDVVLLMTSGIAGEFDAQALLDQVLSSGSLEPESVCSTLMDASEASQEDRTLVVIGGPYERSAEWPVAEVRPAAAPLENELHTANENVEIAGGDALPTNMTVDEDRLFELDEKLEDLRAVLANKADTAELLGLQSEVLKLGVLAKEQNDVAANSDLHSYSNGQAPQVVVRPSSSLRPFTWFALLFAVGLAGAFIGGRINASRTAKVAEAWTVKTSGNEIVISRLNSEGSPSIVTINTARPLNSAGEQNFSSFADVKKYIDTITPSEVPVKVEQVEPEPRTASQSQPRPTPLAPSKESRPAEIVTSIAFRQGDSLKSLAQRYKVAAARLIALNPKITRWSQVKNGQRVVVPAGSVNNRAVSQQSEQSARRRPSKPATRQVTVEAGDTLDRLARRNNLSPSRLKELNPQITNWSRIQPGQKVLVPTPVRG